MDYKKLGPAAQKQLLEKLRSAGKQENKVHAQRTNGYASGREARRAEILKLRQKAGEIYNLREQVKYVLVPAIYETEDGRIVKDYAGEHKRALERRHGKLVLLERELAYIADFVYEEAGQTVVEDAKGMKKTNSALYRVFVNKRKMMLDKYGIRIKEV